MKLISTTIVGFLIGFFISCLFINNSQAIKSTIKDVTDLKKVHDIQIVSTTVSVKQDEIGVNKSNKEYYVYTIEVENDIPADDLRYMSAIIYAEAGNQCEAGRQAVGIVVMNRVASEDFKNTVYDVIHEKGQFTPVKNGSFKKALNLYDRGELPDGVIDAARYALEGNTIVCYKDTEYDLAGYLYFSRYLRGCRLKIEDHMFK